MNVHVCAALVIKNNSFSKDSLDITSQKERKRVSEEKKTQCNYRKERKNNQEVFLNCAMCL